MIGLPCGEETMTVC